MHKGQIKTYLKRFYLPQNTYLCMKKIMNYFSTSNWKVQATL